MSVPAPSGLAAAPPLAAQTLEPAWVRKGSASTQKAYETALAFEQMLVEELSQTLAANSGLGGEEGEPGEGSSGPAGASGPLSTMLPQALSSGVMSAGGLGLAAQMTRSLVGASTTGAAGVVGATTGGTSASTGTGTPGAGEEQVRPATGGTSASTNTGTHLASGKIGPATQGGSAGASTGAPIPQNDLPSNPPAAHTGGTSA